MLDQPTRVVVRDITSMPILFTLHICRAHVTLGTDLIVDVGFSETMFSWPTGVEGGLLCVLWVL